MTRLSKLLRSLMVAAAALLAAFGLGAVPSQSMPSNVVNWALAGSSLNNLISADSWQASHHMNSSLVHVSGNEFGVQNHGSERMELHASC